MDESQSSKELASEEVHLPDQTENDSDVGTQTSTPHRQSTESDNGNSLPSQEPLLENQTLNSSDDNSESGGLSPSRVEINGDIAEPEILLQQRACVPSAAVMPMDAESSFSCKYPGCTFTSMDAEVYLKHEDSHVDGGAVQCDICNVRFPTYANMRRHHLYLHQGIRIFECQFCKKRFLRKEQYNEHLLAHSKPRSYQCNICGAAFFFKAQLRVHFYSDHPDFAEKSCHLCDYKATSPSAIKIHHATYHLKPNMDVSHNSERPNDAIQRVLVRPMENGAIDLATVSQNFSFLASHPPPYSSLLSDSSGIIPGPSDLRTSKVIGLASPLMNPRNLITQSSEQSVAAPTQEESNRHTCVTSVVGSTALVGHPTVPRLPIVSTVDVQSRDRICIKPEPSELAVEDSQNSSVQPTSTMDLTMTDVVETTSTDLGAADVPCRRKVHKHSATDDGSEGRYSPPCRSCPDSHSVPHGNIRIHTCRFRPYEDTSQRCREFSRNAYIAHHRSSERHARCYDSDIERNSQNDHSDEERKVFYSRATSTNVVGPSDLSRGNQSLTVTGNGTMESQSESNFYNRKNTIVIRDIESCTLTCVYCGIIFPDQTLYLLHRSLHSEGSHWKCNLCGKTCKDKYDFNSHVISKGHY